MHKSAFLLGKRFFDLHRPAHPPRILDIGARDINGTLRACAPQPCEYVGIDLQPGPGVDLVLQDAYSYPFPSASFDLIVSTSTFEHDQFFWLSFLECCRVLKDTGAMYINVPSNGSYHGYPYDHWRFYPDAGLALQNWGRRMLHPVTLVESFIGPQFESEWNDAVMIFVKRPDFRPARYLSDDVPYAHNIRRGEEKLRNPQLRNQDQVLIDRLRQELARSSGKA